MFSAMRFAGLNSLPAKMGNQGVEARASRRRYVSKATGGSLAWRMLAQFS